MNLLAADIGGTSMRCALIGQSAHQHHHAATYRSADFPSLLAAVQRYLADVGETPQSACLALAGPVIDQRCVTTNLPWEVEAGELSQALGFPVRLVNDFAAMARGCVALRPDDRIQLAGGEPVAGDPVAVLGAGTGLGEAYVLGGVAVPGEGGHCDFAPTTPREVRLAQWLMATEGRASWEMVLSGPGLVRLARFLDDEELASPAAWLSEADAPARVMQSRPEVVSWFAELLGSEAGNMALRCLTRGGVYLAGGIAPRMVSVLESGGFRRRMLAKGKLAAAIEGIPVYVVTHPSPGLLGAAAIGLEGG